MDSFLLAATFSYLPISVSLFLCHFFFRARNKILPRERRSRENNKGEETRHTRERRGGSGMDGSLMARPPKQPWPRRRNERARTNGRDDRCVPSANTRRRASFTDVHRPRRCRRLGPTLAWRVRSFVHRATGTRGQQDGRATRTRGEGDTDGRAARSGAPRRNTIRFGVRVFRAI